MWICGSGVLSCTLWALSEANLLSRNLGSQNICCTGECQLLISNWHIIIIHNNKNMFTEKDTRFALLKNMGIWKSGRLRKRERVGRGREKKGGKVRSYPCPGMGWTSALLEGCFPHSSFGACGPWEWRRGQQSKWKLCSRARTQNTFSCSRGVSRTTTGSFHGW